MEYEVRLDKQGTQHLAVVRRQAKPAELPTVVPNGCGVVWGVLHAQRVDNAGRHIAVYFDSEINLEVGVEVEEPLPFEREGEVIRSSLPTGRVVVTTHYGPYQQLYKAHEAIRNWSKAKGTKLAGVNWEVYGHWQEEWNTDPMKIQTDVYYLLA